MAQPLRIHRLARQEINQALRWYTERSFGVAVRLRDLIRHSLQTIIASPESWPAFHQTVRAYQLKTFPYVFVYALEDNEVLIIAFQHTSRRPGYWMRRLKIV